MLGMPAYRLTLPESSGCPWIVLKHSHSANNLKNWGENRNLMEMIHLLMVLGMPDHHPTIPVWFGCTQMVPKGSHTRGNSKMVKKSTVSDKTVPMLFYI
jgi:hypothetical protein